MPLVDLDLTGDILIASESIHIVSPIYEQTGKMIGSEVITRPGMISYQTKLSPEEIVAIIKKG